MKYSNPSWEVLISICCSHRRLTFLQLSSYFARSLLPLAASGEMRVGGGGSQRTRLRSSLSAIQGFTRSFNGAWMVTSIVLTAGDPFGLSWREAHFKVVLESVFPLNSSPFAWRECEAFLMRYAKRTEAETLNESIIPRSWNFTDSTPCFFSFSLSRRASEISDLISLRVVLFAPFD